MRTITHSSLGYEFKRVYQYEIVNGIAVIYVDGKEVHRTIEHQRYGSTTSWISAEIASIDYVNSKAS